MPEGKVLHPVVEWAQRQDVLYLSFDVEDAKLDELDITDEKLHFKAHGGHYNADFICDLQFFGQVDGKNYRRVNNDRRVELVIPKKVVDGSGTAEGGDAKRSAKSAWWPRLLQEKGRVPWIKVDFQKWKDEEDSDADGEDYQFDDMMRGLGGGGAFPSGPPDLDELDGNSDNDDMPDLEDAPPEDKDEDENLDAAKVTVDAPTAEKTAKDSAVVEEASVAADDGETNN